MKTRHAVVALVIVNALASGSGWAQATKPEVTPPQPGSPTGIPEKAAPTPPKAPVENQDKQEKPAADETKRAPAPAGGEGGTDSRGPSGGKGGAGSTGQGGMPGSGATSGSGGSTDTR